MSSETLEELAEEAAEIIAARRGIFDHLRLLIFQRFTDLTGGDSVRVGRHVLLNKQDLNAAFEEPGDRNPRTPTHRGVSGPTK